MQQEPVASHAGIPGRMQRLIYISSAVAGLGPSDLTSILESARANNLRDDVTGVLLYHDGSFIQVLEGQAEVLDVTFARILRSSRHDGVIVLSRTDVADRLFSGWHMAFSRPERLVDPQEAAVIPFRRLMQDLGALEDRDPRVAILVRSFLSGFRDLGPEG